MNTIGIQAFFVVVSLGDLLAMDPQMPASLTLDLSAARTAATSPAGRIVPPHVEIGFCHSCKLRDKPVSKLFQACEHTFCDDCQRAKLMSDCDICPECPVCFERDPALPPLVCGHHICSSPCSGQWRPTCRQENNLQLARDTQCVSCAKGFTDVDATSFTIIVTQCSPGNICCFHQNCFVNYIERTAYWDEKRVKRYLHARSIKQFSRFLRKMPSCKYAPSAVKTLLAAYMNYRPRYVSNGR